MNRMNNKTLVIIIAVLLVSNMALLGMYVFSGREKHEPNRGDKSPADFMIRELKLNDHQAASFNTLWEATKEKNKPVFDSLRVSRENLYSNLKIEPQPDSQIINCTKKLAEFEQQLALNNYVHFKKVRELLDSGQKVKLDTLIQRMGKRIGGRKKPG